MHSSEFAFLPFFSASSVVRPCSAACWRMSSTIFTEQECPLLPPLARTNPARPWPWVTLGGVVVIYSLGPAGGSLVAELFGGRRLRLLLPLRGALEVAGAFPGAELVWDAGVFVVHDGPTLRWI